MWNITSYGAEKQNFPHKLNFVIVYTNSTKVCGITDDTVAH